MHKDVERLRERGEEEADEEVRRHERGPDARGEADPDPVPVLVVRIATLLVVGHQRRGDRHGDLQSPGTCELMLAYRQRETHDRDDEDDGEEDSVDQLDRAASAAAHFRFDCCLVLSARSESRWVCRRLAGWMLEKCKKAGPAKALTSQPCCRLAEPQLRAYL